VGLAHDATIRWLVERGGLGGEFILPVTGEIWDGWLNDINGFHITELDVFAALDSAAAGAIDEGSVGGGTGMVCYGFKGGSGTASRRVAAAGGDHTVGAFVQANFGLREQLVIAGRPVGRGLKDWAPDTRATARRGRVNRVDYRRRGHRCAAIAASIGQTGSPRRAGRRTQRGSLRPWFGRHLHRLFHTEALDAPKDALAKARFIPDPALGPLFAAVIQSVDEAILNALVANETMTGIDNRTVHALPHDEVRRILGLGEGVA